MSRTLRTIRRSIRAALRAGRHMVSAAVSAHHRLLVHLFHAIDAGATVRIRYTDEAGAETVRTIRPHGLAISTKGHVIVTAHDELRGEKRTFRTDRVLALEVA